MPKIRKPWISREEFLAEAFPVGNIVDLGDIGGLTPGSIPFGDAAGFLIEDNAALFWDAANEVLKLTSATTLLIDLHPGFTGPGEVIKITPSAAIDTIDAEWDGIVIDGAALDPSVIGVQVDGLHIDFSTIDLTNDPHLDGIYIQMPSCLCGIHGIHLEGELHINLDAAAAVTGETYTGLDVVIGTVGSTGGDLHVLDVARSGVGAVAIAAVATHEGIDIIHQAIGTFVAADKIWEYDNDGPTWIDVTAGVGSIWDDKDDLLYVGHASTFSEIKFIFSVMATKNMHFKFYFSTGGAGWTQFYPADDTNGATQNGSVRYTAISLPTWAVDTVHGIAGKYWIRIDRTRTSGTGPTTSSMQQLAPTLYGWDKLGAITALSVNLVNTINEFSTDGTLGGNSDNAVPTEKAVKTYVDAVGGDVTAAAVLADHTLIRGDGGAKGIQDSGIDIDDADNITLPDGAAINLQEDITFLGATTENLIKFPNNLANAFSFMEGVNPYLTFVTTNGSEAVLIPKIVDLTSGQIAFPAAQSASADPNTLDDYEEGTWTPVLVGSITPGDHTYGANTTGAYVKIGKLLSLTFVITLTNKGTIDGNIQIGGIPFAMPDVPNRYSQGAGSFFAMTTNWNSINISFVGSTTLLMLTGTKVAGVNTVNVDDADLSNTSSFHGNIIVYTA